MKLVFMGSPAFAVPALQAVAARHRIELCVSQPHKPTGRGQKVAAPPVAELAAGLGIPLAQPRSVKTPEFLETLAKTGADAAVVVAYGKILPRAVLEVFPHGCLNIHASLLPAYRGAAPIPWCIVHGERETGITIMRLDEGMDTGPMLMKSSLEIRPGDTAGSLAERLAPLGAELVLAALTALEEGRLVETAQDAARASYAPMLKKSDGVLDWQQAAATVANRARGMDPWPGASSTVGDAPIKLFGPRACAGAGAPGAVLALDADGLLIGCGEGTVRFEEVQMAGKRRMRAAEFARGRALPEGTVLGQSQRP